MLKSNQMTYLLQPFFRALCSRAVSRRILDLTKEYTEKFLILSQQKWKYGEFPYNDELCC